jgi:hypothetical protein
MEDQFAEEQNVTGFNDLTVFVEMSACLQLDYVAGKKKLTSKVWSKHIEEGVILHKVEGLN